MPVVTSSLRIDLIDDVSANAKHVAAALEAAQKQAVDLAGALARSGTSDRLQGNLKKLGASAASIDAVSASWKDYVKAQGLAEDRSTWTKAQRDAVRSWEGVSTSAIRAVMREEGALGQKRLQDRAREIEQEKSAAQSRIEAARRATEGTLAVERRMLEQIAAEDQKAANKRIAIAVAAEHIRASLLAKETHSAEAALRDEQKIRAAIEAAITQNTRREQSLRVAATQEEAAAIERIANLEKATRIRAVEAETRAIISARHREQERLAEQQQHAIYHHGVANYVLGGVAAAASVHGVMSVVEESLKAGADYAHARTALQNVGRTPAELAAIDARSRETVSLVPTTTYTENEKVIAETTNAFGTLNHAIENLPFVQKTSSILKSVAGDKIDGDAAELGQLYAKFFEMRGTAGNVETFQKEGNEMTRAMVATGGVFNPQEMFNFAQQAKTTLQGYDLRFLSKIAPSIIGEIHGERAGTAAAAFDKVISGSVSDKTQAKEWVRLGLIDPKMVNEGKGGVISWKDGAVHGTAEDPRLAHHDPMEWFQKVALPAMRQHGVDTNDRDAVLAELRLMFRKPTANMWASEFALPSNIQRLENVEANINKVLTPDQIYENYLKNDPTTSMTALKASFENLLSAVSSPLMTSAAGTITNIAAALNYLANAAKDHPLAATTGGAVVAGAGLASVGVLGYKLMYGSGFRLGAAATGLSTSAAALDGAAAALDGAAVKLGATGAVKGAMPTGTAPEGAIPGAPETVAPKAGLLGAGGVKGLAGSIGEGVVGALVYDAGTRAITAVLDALPHPTYPAGYDPQAIRNQGVAGDLARLKEDLFGSAKAVRGTPTEEDRATRARASDAPEKSLWHRIFGAADQGVLPVSFANDSTTTMSFERAVALGVFDGMTNFANRGSLGRDSVGGAGGEIINTSYETGDNGAGGVAGGNGATGSAPSLRYGRQHTRGPATAPQGLFDAISQAEGTTRDGYDTTLGNGKWGTPDKPLSSMTLDEVKAFGLRQRQAQVTAGIPWDATSSANGMFQITGSTMADAAKALGLPGSTIFNGDTQKSMAGWIARTQGLGAWEGFKSHPGLLAAARNALNSGDRQPGELIGTGAAGAAVDNALKLNGASASQAAQAFGAKMTPGEWCADFVNGAFKSAGMKGVNSSMALAFSSWGHAVGLNDVKKGDVLLENHGGGHGHAGLATGAVRRDAAGNIIGVQMVSGNYGHKVSKNWESPGEIAAVRRTNETESPLPLKRKPPAPAPHHELAHAIEALNDQGIAPDVDHSGVLTLIGHLRTAHALAKGLNGRSGGGSPNRIAGLGSKLRGGFSHAGSDFG